MIQTNIDAAHFNDGVDDYYNIDFFELGDRLRQAYQQDDPRALMRGPDGPVTMTITTHPTMLERFRHRELREDCLMAFRLVFPSHSCCIEIGISVDEELPHRRLCLTVAGA